MNHSRLFYAMTRSASETLSYNNFEDRIPPYVLKFVSSFFFFFFFFFLFWHFNAKTLFTFVWLEFRFKSFLEMYIRMHKLHEERQVSADAHSWCQISFSFSVPKFVSKYLTTKQLSQIFGWSVRTLAQYTLNITGLTVCRHKITKETDKPCFRIWRHDTWLISLLSVAFTSLSKICIDSWVCNYFWKKSLGIKLMKRTIYRFWNKSQTAFHKNSFHK